MRKIEYYFERFSMANFSEKLYLFRRFFLTIYAFRIGNLLKHFKTVKNINIKLGTLQKFSLTNVGIRRGCVLIQNHYFSLIDLEETNWISLPSCKCALFVEEVDFVCDPDSRTIIELNRLTWLLPLMVRSTNEDKEYVVQILKSYFQSNFVSREFRWISPIDVSVQLIVIALTVEFMEGFSQDAIRKGKTEIWSRYFFLSKVQSKYSSANNHLIYELLGQCIYLGDNARWEKNRKSVFEHLRTTLVQQYYTSGLNKELSTGYHFGLLDLFSFIFLVSVDQELKDIVLNQLKKSMIASDYLCKFTQEFTQIGDTDSSYILSNLFLPQVRNTCILENASRITGEPVASVPDKELLLGQYSIEKSSIEPWLVSVVINHEDSLPLEQYSITTDVGPFGLGPLGAHGHSDSLSVLLSINKEEIFIDRGTHNYTSNPHFRNILRSSRAHNTVSINRDDLRISKFPFISHHHNPICDSDFKFIPNGANVIAELSGRSLIKTTNTNILHDRIIQFGRTEFRINDTVTSEDKLPFFFEYNYTLHPRIKLRDVELGSKVIELESPKSTRFIVKIEGQVTVSITRVPISPSFGKVMWTNNIQIEGHANRASSVKLLGILKAGKFNE